MSRDWVCPHCGTVFEKERIVQDLGARGSTERTQATVDCPHCHRQVSLDAMIGGKYDKKWWHFGRQRVPWHPAVGKMPRPGEAVRLMVWLEDREKAADRDVVALLVARIAREKGWDHERAVELTGAAHYGNYEVVPDTDRGGCHVVFK